MQKISIKNKKNRAKNEIPPTVGSHSLARTVDTVSSLNKKSIFLIYVRSCNVFCGIYMKQSRRAGKEVPETEQWRMAHYSEERKAMINEKADILWVILIYIPTLNKS